MILEQFDENKKAVINPGDSHDPIKDFPKLFIGVFSEVIVNEYIQNHDSEVISYVKFASGDMPVYRVKTNTMEFALCTMLVGAPAAAAFIEDGVAWGAECFVVFGSCGVLQNDIADGHLIIPTCGVRDEGLSYHYMPPSDEVEAEPESIRALTEAMENLGLPYVTGKGWTTDAFYRETPKKVAHRKASGCICVDMEFTALTAVSKFRDVKFAEFFYAADTLVEGEWDARNLGQKGASVSQKCMSAAIETGRLLVDM